MTERKKILLRLDPAVHDALARWAGDELRSTNAQIEFLLRGALTSAGRLPPTVGRIPRRGRPPKDEPDADEPDADEPDKDEPDADRADTDGAETDEPDDAGPPADQGEAGGAPRDAGSPPDG